METSNSIQNLLPWMFNEPSNIIFLAYFVICINLMKNFLGSRTVTPRKIYSP